MYFEKRYEISTMDLDCFDHCRASALLGYLQDAAGLAAGQYGATNPEMIQKHGHCWMVVRTAFTLARPLRWGDVLTIRTWHRGGEKPLMYRDFELSVDGQSVGQALSIWVLVDLQTHAMTRPDRFPEFAGTDGGELIRATKLPKAKLPSDLAPVGKRLLYYSETDGNGHVNNTRYADFLCDALELHKDPPGTFVKEFYISYLQECKAGETLELLAGETDGQRHVLGQDAAGVHRFHGYAVTGESFP